ncbi:MAG TPA: O-antigen ligase family protein, partial [Alphaproteobacteria bacterium]
AMMLFQGRRAAWRFPSAGCAIALALFWLWMGISLTWSAAPYISMIFALIIGSLPFLFFATIQHPRADALIRGQMIGVGAILVLMAAWAVIQFALLPDLAGARIRHPMLNPNNLAVLFVMGAFPMLWAFSSLKGVRMIVSGLLLGLLVCAMMMTQSRGGLLGLVCGAGLFMVCCRDVLKERWKRFVIFGCVLAVTLGALFLTISGRQDHIRLLGGGHTMASVDERFLLLGSALKMLADDPFPGIGLGVFYLAFPPFRHVNDLSDGFFVHIDPLQFAIEMSPIAAVLFYAFCIAVLIRTLRALRQPQARQGNRLAVVLPFCSLLALLINAHVNFDLYMLPALMLAAIMMAAWYEGTERILGPARKMLALNNKAHLAFLAPLFLLLFIAAPAWVARAGLSVHESALLSQAMQDNDAVAAQTHIDRASRYGIGSYYRSYYLNALWRGQELRAQSSTLDAAQREAAFQAAQTLLDQAILRNPYYVQALSQKALLYYTVWPGPRDEALEQARALIEQAVRIDPISFDLRSGLAKILDDQGKTQEAIAVLEEGNRWQAIRRYAPPYYTEMLIQF